MAGPHLKLYRIKHANVWPYESVSSVTPVEREACAAVPADFHDESTYRCYRRHPDQFVDLAPMEAYDESWEGSVYEISPYQLIADRPLAFQIEYVVFRSWRAADYVKLQPLIDLIKKGGLEVLGFPADLRPGRAILMGDDESHPWERHRLEGTQPPDHPTSAFIIPERSDLPYINDHTIPEGIDYQFVQAAVVSYDFYEIPPTYDWLMKRLDRYCGWFGAMTGKAEKNKAPKEDRFRPSRRKR
jgi:hypothetical protein